MDTSLRNKIYEKVKRKITLGELAPGERLIESILAKEFNVSRSPVREALRLLEVEGLIEFRRNKGITVAKFSIKQVEEIYDLLWILEGYAAHKASMDISDKSLDLLKAMHEGLKAAAKNGNLKKWFDHNAQFHNFFYKNCGNDNLVKVVGDLKSKIQKYDYLTVGVPEDFETFVQQHEKILQGCIKRDGAMVKKYMQVHLEAIKITLIGHLKNQWEQTIILPKNWTKVYDNLPY